jgi:hypothetical protein
MKRGGGRAEGNRRGARATGPLAHIYRLNAGSLLPLVTLASTSCWRGWLAWNHVHIRPRGRAPPPIHGVRVPHVRGPPSNQLLIPR